MEISTNEESGSSSGASLYLYGGVAVDYVNSEYGTGGEIHIEEGSEEQQPVIIGNIYLTYEDEVGLDQSVDPWRRLLASDWRYCRG